MSEPKDDKGEKPEGESNPSNNAGGESLVDNPKFQEAVKEQVAKLTEGLQKNRDDLKAEKKELQEKLNSFQSQWDGLDAKKVKETLALIEKNEDVKLLAEGKNEEVLQKRTQRLTEEHDRVVQGLNKQIEDLTSQNAGFQNQIKTLRVEGEIRQAAVEQGLVPSAIDDALTRANSLFNVDDTGNLVAQEAGGSTVMGKDGKAPLTPAEWLEDMRPKASHWWPAPAGAGAQGGGSTPTQPHTLSREAARDRKTYLEAKAKAEAAGQTLSIVA